MRMHEPPNLRRRNSLSGRIFAATLTSNPETENAICTYIIATFKLLYDARALYQNTVKSTIDAHSPQTYACLGEVVPPRLVPTTKHMFSDRMCTNRRRDEAMRLTVASRKKERMVVGYWVKT